MAVWLRTNAAADPAVWFGVNDVPASEMDPVDLASSTTLTSPTMSNLGDMVPVNLTSSSSLSLPSMSNLGDMDPLDLVSASSLSAPTMTEVGIIYKTNNIVVF